MSTDIVKAEEKISILEKKDWNNERDLIVFKKEFIGAQNLQSAIKEFYKSFILSKIIKESDLINLPDLNWFYVSEPYSYNSKRDEQRIIEFFQAQIQRKLSFHLVESSYPGVLIYKNGKTERIIERDFYKSPVLISFKNQSKIVLELGGREFLDKIKEEYSEFIELSRKNIKNQYFEDERYWIINEYGQPLLVSTKKSLEFIKIELHETEGFLRVVCPIVRDNYVGPFSFYNGLTIYDVSPGEIVQLDFNIATNELINYSTSRY